MRIAIGLYVLASASACLAADGRLFVTNSSDPNQPWGLTIPDNALWPTTGTGLDFTSGEYVVGSFPPADTASSTFTAGDVLYVWLQFDDVPINTLINGIQIGITDEMGGFPALELAYYVCDNSANAPGFYRRWNTPATPPDYPEYRANPATFVAIDTYGIRYSNAPTPELMYNGAAAGGITLLGAFRAPAGSTEDLSIDVLSANYATGTPGEWLGATAVYVPEPASIVALFVACTALRRWR